MVQEVPAIWMTPAARAMTIADVIRRIELDDTLRPRRRRQFMSALRTLCRQLGTKPTTVPAHPQILRQRLEEIREGVGRLSRRQWILVRCRTFAALRHAGVPA